MNRWWMSRLQLWLGRGLRRPVRRRPLSLEYLEERALPGATISSLRPPMRLADGSKQADIADPARGTDLADAQHQRQEQRAELHRREHHAVPGTERHRQLARLHHRPGAGLERHVSAAALQAPGLNLPPQGTPASDTQQARLKVGALLMPGGGQQALDQIDHFVVIYQENWSFDALYGSSPGVNGLANASTTSLTQIDRRTGQPSAHRPASPSTCR